ncbi:MAG: HAMP domain-containing sensor histidine kinase [Gemmatimonadaceae bacterium]
MEGDEERLLHSVALQNANSIFLARQRAEQELRRTKEALESKTAALAEARRAAQAANDAKDRFLSMISHELRTPLGAIGGYAALLAEEIQGSLTDGQREYIAGIRHNQKHLLRLVNELLDLAKIESGKFVLNLSAVPVQGVLESVQTMIEPQIRACDLRLEIESDDPALSLHADRARVEQIVLNLLSNAVKFTPAGGVVRITTAPGTDKVRLSVQDTGIGIPEGKLDAVFEPFVQVESSQSRAGRGTGLGLAISRELARAMGGDLTVESVRGKGSEFTLSLPRA